MANLRIIFISVLFHFKILLSSYVQIWKPTTCLCHYEFSFCNIFAAFLYKLFNNALTTFHSNITITALWIRTGKYCPRLVQLRGQYCEYRTKKHYYCIYCQRVDKKKQRHFAIASLCQGTASHCNGCVAFKKAVC